MDNLVLPLLPWVSSGKIAQQEPNCTVWLTRGTKGPMCLFLNYQIHPHVSTLNDSYTFVNVEFKT